MKKEHFPRWAIYNNLQVGFYTGTTEVNGHIIYKICTVKI